MTNNIQLVPAQPTSPDSIDYAVLERLLSVGDISKLSIEDKTKYLFQLAKSYGLNPMMRPFDIMTNRDGREVVYANKNASVGLAQKYNLSLTPISAGPTAFNPDLYEVEIEAKAPDGRSVRDVGCVWIKAKSGEELANAVMKCWTKAKRRATLTFAGVGFNDESERDDGGWTAAPAEPKEAVARTITPKA